MLRRTLLRVGLCILLVQHITDGEIENIDGLQNKDIVLCPVFEGELEEITWKLGDNKIAEYDLFKTILYYGDFKNQTELNITSGCLKMNNITDRWDGLYTAELQINEQLQYLKFKLKVYRPVSKPHVTCTVTDSIVTLLCEGDESLGNHYRWEDRENKALLEGKNLTLSKEENDNIEYTCIFSNIKSEARSDPVKNCFVTVLGGRSHVWVLIPVVVALIVCGYKYSQSKDSMLHKTNKCDKRDSEHKPDFAINMESTDQARKQEDQASSEKTSGNSMSKGTNSTEENSGREERPNVESEKDPLVNSEIGDDATRL